MAGKKSVDQATSNKPEVWVTSTDLHHNGWRHKPFVVKAEASAKIVGSLPQPSDITLHNFGDLKCTKAEKISDTEWKYIIE